MPGLSEDADGAMSFDTANGRIAETIASGQVVPENVLGYYKRALPQLGWKRLTATRYRREDEVLNLCSYYCPHHDHHHLRRRKY